jgi:hypothetical protein
LERDDAGAMLAKVLWDEASWREILCARRRLGDMAGRSIQILEEDTGAKRTCLEMLRG